MKKVISSGDVDPGFDLGMAVPELDEAGFNSGDIKVVQAKDMKSKAEEAKFMQEKVLVEVEGGTENDPVFIPAGHNGTMQYIQRGTPQAIRRKYLYSLLMAKKINIGCEFRRKEGGGEYNKLTPSPTSTYRVNLLQDNNPQGGMKWFKDTVASAG